MKEKKVVKKVLCDCVNVTYNCFYDNYQLKDCPVIYTEISLNITEDNFNNPVFIKNVNNMLLDGDINIIETTITKKQCTTNERLLNLYPNIKFSPKWNNEIIPRYMGNDGTTFDEEYNKWKIYYTKNLLEPFDIFYKKYKPYNQPKSLDLYYFQDLKQTDGLKEQFDKIINGELYVDVEFMTPDSPIRNYMKIISFDESKLKR